ELHNTALLDRAIAYLRGGEFDLSRKDYEALDKTIPSSYRIKYGLAEIAYRTRDTNAAIRNYQLYLGIAPTNTTEAAQVRDRLKELTGGKP
ncbi:MAG TPA: tetratricopeptide repeat protein, partial [Verrucomicrobiae bacterium]|nr:tetratricopeptide repeat protein [Verrucomicrobiae bacterium]